MRSPGGLFLPQLGFEPSSGGRRPRTSATLPKGQEEKNLLVETPAVHARAAGEADKCPNKRGWVIKMSAAVLLL